MLLIGISFKVGASSIDSLVVFSERAVQARDYETLEENAKLFYKWDGIDARLYENYYLGIVAQNTYQYESSKTYFLKAIELSRSTGDSCYLGRSLQMLSVSYFYLSKKRKLISVGREIIDEELPCISEAKIYLSIGAAYRRLNSFDTARTYLDLALEIGKKEEPIVVPFVYNHICDILSETGDSLSAIRLRRKVLEWLDTASYSNHKGLYISYLGNQARDYISVGLLDSGVSFYNMGLDYALKTGNKYPLPSLYCAYALYWSQSKNYDSANFYYIKAFSAAESAKNYDIRQLALDNIQIALGNKVLLQELKSEKASLQRNISILIGAGVLLLCLLLIRLSRQRTKHQEVLRAKDAEVHQKELEGLLAGQEVQVVEALVEGQEHERKRLSQELHDTIGSMLATLKLQFESLTDLFDVSNDKQESKIEFTNDLLDRTCIEVRRISHNLSSGMVSKVGVVEAIRQVSNNINSSGKLAVEFVSEVDDINLQGDAAVHLFRVVQELFSNIIKHSKASKLSVQISAFENEVTLIIEDNGVGFDYQKALREGKGLGLSNLATRVQQLNGQLNIDSAIGRGTTAIIELTV